MFGPLAKWVAQIDRAERIPELVARAYTTACAGRPGPVVLALPEDMLAAETEAAGRTALPRRAAEPRGRRRRVAAPLLARAERPFLIVGGAGWTPAASDGHPRASSRRTSCRPAPRSGVRTRSTTTRRAMPATSASASIRRSPSACASADLLLAVGRAARRDDDVRVHAARRPAAAADARARASRAPRSSVASTRRSSRSSPAWSSSPPRCATCASSRGGREWTRAARAGLRGVAAALADAGCARPRRRASRTLRERVPDAIVTNGAGNHTVWAHRFWRFHRYPSQLAPTSGAMGYGVPAALAAKASRPSGPSSASPATATS